MNVILNFSGLALNNQSVPFSLFIIHSNTRIPHRSQGFWRSLMLVEAASRTQPRPQRFSNKHFAKKRDFPTECGSVCQALQSNSAGPLMSARSLPILQTDRGNEPKNTLPVQWLAFLEKNWLNHLFFSLELYFKWFLLFQNSVSVCQQRFIHIKRGHKFFLQLFFSKHTNPSLYNLQNIFVSWTYV